MNSLPQSLRPKSAAIENDPKHRNAEAEPCSGEKCWKTRQCLPISNGRISNWAKSRLSRQVARGSTAANKPKHSSILDCEAQRGGSQDQDVLLLNRHVGHGRTVQAPSSHDRGENTWSVECWLIGCHPVIMARSQSTSKQIYATTDFAERVDGAVAEHRLPPGRQICPVLQKV